MCGGARTHAEGGVSYGHCASSWGPTWDSGQATVYNQGPGCRIRQLERELVEAKAELERARQDRNEAAMRERNKYLSQLTANKAALEKCHELLTKITQGHFYQSSCRGGEMERLMNQAIQSVSAVNHNQSSQ